MKPSIAKNWSVLADPMYSMHLRTGYSIEQVNSLSAEEAVRFVWGDERAEKMLSDGKIVACNNVMAKIFELWCKLQLRQTVVLGGASELNFTSVPYGVAVESVAFDFTQREELEVEIQSASFGLDADFLRECESGIKLAREGKDVVVGRSFVKTILESIHGELPKTLRFVDPIKSFNYLVSQQDVAMVIEGLNQVVGDKFISYEVQGEDLVVTFDQEHQFKVTANSGVFEMSRNRRFGNILLVDRSPSKASAKTDASECQLINSYGSFLAGLLVFGAGHLCAAQPEMGKLVRQLTSGVWIPLVSLDELGAVDGDRVSHEEYVTVNRSLATEMLPFQFAFYYEGDALQYQVVPTHLCAFESEKPGDMSLHDRTALLDFNLARSPKGYLVDGRKCCVQTKHIPEADRVAYTMELAAQQAGGAEKAESWVRKQFKTELSGDALWSFVSNHLIVGLSSKLNKLIKRTVMDAAVVGFVVDGKSRGFKRLDQENASLNNWLVEAIVSPFAIHAPGVALYWGDAPKLMVEHTQTRMPNLSLGDTPIEQAIVPEFDGNYSFSKGVHKVSYSKDVYLSSGDVICSVLFEADGNKFPFYFKADYDDCLLNSIEWSVAKVNGNKKTLKVKISTLTVESQIKCRNYVKAMLGRTDKECVINELNGNLNARSIFFRDTNKWLDLVCQMADVAACTAITNQDAEGLALIKQVNKLVGVKGAEELVYSPLVAVTQGYKPLVDWFEQTYGRAVWFKWADPSGEMTRVLKAIYYPNDSAVKGWEVANDLEVTPVGASDVLTLVQKESDDSRDNVLVFYTLNGESHFMQRAWSFVASEGQLPVWQPVKAELSSVRASSVTTPMMAGVIRSIEQEDARFAKNLAVAGFEHIDHCAKFNVMLKGNTFSIDGNELPVYNLSDVSTLEMLQTEELVQLVVSPESQGKLFSLLADKFNNCVFKVGDYSLHLPTIASQDANRDFIAADTLSDLIQSLFVQCICGGEKSELFGNLIARIKGALVAFVQSPGINKCIAYGPKGVQAKPLASFEVPVSEVWVKQSDLSDSVYQRMIRVFGCTPGDLDGRKVVLSRAPMTNYSTLIIRVVSSALYEDHTIYLSALASVMNGGDYDGDNNSIYDAESSQLKVTTLDDIVKSVTNRTGSDQFVPGGNYWGDYFEIPSQAAIAKKRKISAKNLSLDTGMSMDKPEDRLSLPVMIEGSTKMFLEAVGCAHQLFLTGDYYLSISRQVKQIKAGLNLGRCVENKELVSVLAEIYEVPLGGLDWGAYDVFYKALFRVLYEKRMPTDLGNLAEMMEQAGMNSKASADVLEIAKLLRKKQMPEADEELKVPSTEEMVYLAAKTSFSLSKGKPCSYTTEFEMMTLWAGSTSGSKEIIESSVALMTLEYYRTTVVAASLGLEVNF